MTPARLPAQAPDGWNRYASSASEPRNLVRRVPGQLPPSTWVPSRPLASVPDPRGRLDLARQPQSLPKPQAEAFAQLTGQTTREVSALTLAQWRDRYPPIARSMPAPGRLMRPDAWLYAGSPRFCPSCLAGDGTATQQLHGGPWLKLWHLPIVFACTKHRIYLEAKCPHCGQPHDTQGPLVQRANDHTLHPAQCRWTVDAQTPRRKSLACAGRLDHRTTPACDQLQPTADILRFQKSIRGRLKSPTRTTDASEYFTDLRLATALISTTLPHSRDLLDAKTAERIDSNSQKLHDDSGGRRNSKSATRHRATPLSAELC
ncbi:TniQ family protein [Streptomyces sp. NPDC056672]|uniref:TniQ family protein n=1 Tax=Streptomyces sp. NPDC056672 TaxID=3345906 RepID=UPI003688170D